MDFATLDRRALARYGVVDLLGILAMLWVGELTHGNDPLTSPFLYLDTLAPFLLGWIVAAYVLGAYGERTLDGYRPAIGYALVAWVAADVVGQVLRGSSLFHGGSDPIFFLVMLATVGGALTVGRAVVIAVGGD